MQVLPTPWAGVAETHTATVFFAGDHALKVKKPVDLGFLDFRSRESRLAACRAEVALNRRLAPDVYLGVADIVMDGRPVDHAVVMRRLPAERSLSALIRAGDERAVDAVGRLAAILARFHARSAVVGVDLPSTRTVPADELWRANLDGAREAHLPAIDLDPIAALGERYVTGRAALFHDRLADGFVREGHGDLLADDVFVLDDGPRVLDCLEFDDRLRAVDVLLDIASLMADLERLGRPELAQLLVTKYAAESGSGHPATLEHFYVAYRALVRAKVAAIRASQQHDRPGVETARLLGICRHHLLAAQPTLVVLGGLPGAGKTTVGTAVAAELAGIRLSTDSIRRQLTPAVLASTAYGQGRYDPAVTELVYAEMLDRARRALDHGEHVVVDASWSAARHRQAARRLAGETSAELVEICLVVPDDVARRRLERRAPDPQGSEADIAVRERMSRLFEPWPEAVDIPATAAVDRTAAAVLALARAASPRPHRRGAEEVVS